MLGFLPSLIVLGAAAIFAFRLTSSRPSPPGNVVVGHPLLALAQGGYFPGLISSPFVAAACFWLWQRLRRATEQAR